MNKAAYLSSIDFAGNEKKRNACTPTVPKHIETDTSLASRFRATLEIIAREAKAESIEWIEVSGRSPITDYLLLCSGRSIRHTQAIAEQFSQQTKHLKLCLHRSIDPTGAWHVLDFDIIIVHIMLPETRIYYDLGSLWKTTCSS